MIEQITYQEILPIWKYHLWTQRVSVIESNSAMCFKGGYSMYNMTTKPTFLAYKIDNNIAGVCSGHMCENLEYRIRGLFVFEAYRGNNIGYNLVKATLEQGRNENASLCWSYPRTSSYKIFMSVGFQLYGDFEVSETGNNVYCYYHY